MKRSELKQIIREEIAAVIKSKAIREYSRDFIEDDESLEDQDTYATDGVSRADLNKLINMLSAADISYYVNGSAETIAFDMTELNRQQQAAASKLLAIEKPIHHGEYKIKNISPANLEKVKDLLTAAGVQFYVNPSAKTIAFDITKLKGVQQLQLIKLLDIVNQNKKG